MHLTRDETQIPKGCHFFGPLCISRLVDISPLCPSCVNWIKPIFRQKKIAIAVARRCFSNYLHIAQIVTCLLLSVLKASIILKPTWHSKWKITLGEVTHAPPVCLSNRSNCSAVEILLSIHWHVAAIWRWMQAFWQSTSVYLQRASISS